MNKQLDRYEKMLSRLPIIADWVIHNGVDVVIMPNYEATVKAKRPMVDVSYCMTKALNNSVLFTTQWNKNKFHPSKLANSIWVK